MKNWGIVVSGFLLLGLAHAEEKQVEDSVAVVRESARTFVPAKAIDRTDPRYPVHALRGREAWVQISYSIDESGTPQDISILDSTGDESFESEALKAASNWRFEPALVDGQPAWQSNNSEYIIFAIDRGFRGASRSFARIFKRFVRQIDIGQFEKADESFQTLLQNDRLNLYEISKLWSQRARYEIRRGDIYKADLAMHRATASGGQWTDRKSYKDLLAAHVRIELQLGFYAAAFTAYEELNTKAGSDSPLVLELKPTMDQLRQVVDSDTVLKVKAEVRKRGECFGCNDSYNFTPVRRRFTFSDIEGKLSSIEMRCTHKRFESEFSDQVEWHIPEAWGSCGVHVYGEPGTTFTVLILPDA